MPSGGRSGGDALHRLHLHGREFQRGSYVDRTRGPADENVHSMSRTGKLADAQKEELSVIVDQSLRTIIVIQGDAYAMRTIAYVLPVQMYPRPPVGSVTQPPLRHVSLRIHRRSRASETPNTAGRQPDRDRWTERQTDRQASRQASRQAGRQASRQPDNMVAEINTEHLEKLKKQKKRKNKKKKPKTHKHKNIKTHQRRIQEKNRDRGEKSQEG